MAEISIGLLSASPSGFAIREQMPPLGPQLSWRDLEAVGSAKANSFVGGTQLMQPFSEVLIGADPRFSRATVLEVDISNLLVAISPV